MEVRATGQLSVVLGRQDCFHPPKHKLPTCRHVIRPSAKQATTRHPWETPARSCYESWVGSYNEELRADKELHKKLG